MRSAAGPAAAVLAAAVLLGGCSGADSGSDAGSAEPTAPEQAVHSVALTAADLPAGWTVEESPTDPNIADDPTFLGLCDFEFRSEQRRTAKVPVTGIDPDGSAVLTTEAVAYDAPEGAELALAELRSAYATCPPGQTFTEVPATDQTGLATDRVVVEYTLLEGTTQTVVVQRRGTLLSVILGEARPIVLDAARAIFQRMAALSPEAAGEV